jgi:hypothetical protein
MEGPLECKCTAIVPITASMTEDDLKAEILEGYGDG